MKVADMNWRDVEAAAARDPRCVLPIGSTEQHAQLSLCVDLILAEKVATEAAERDLRLAAARDERARNLHQAKKTAEDAARHLDRFSA